MRHKLSSSSSRFLRTVILCALVVATVVIAAPGSSDDMKFQAILIWATNAEKSPKPEHKEVDADIKKRLQSLPLKWSNFFEERRETFTVSPRGTREVTLSDRCRIRVKDIDGKNLEISHIGKGVPTLKRTEPLPKGEMLILGGNAPASTGWLVVLQRIE